MLYRELDDGRVLALSQLTHAWVAAELMRAWSDPQPDEVLLGATHHDIGWLAWEQAPTLDAERGRPFDYRRVSTAEHVAVWSTAAPLAMAYGRVAAWLTSRHGTRLYEDHDYASNTPEEASEARAFVAREEARQRELLTQISVDPALAQRFDSATLEQASLLLNGCDRLSLALCHGVRGTSTLDNILLHGTPTTLTLTAQEDAVAMSPWPFSARTWQATVDGRVLTDVLQDNADVQAWLATAGWEAVTLRAVPGNE